MHALARQYTYTYIYTHTPAHAAHTRARARAHARRAPAALAPGFAEAEQIEPLLLVVEGEQPVGKEEGRLVYRLAVRAPLRCRTARRSGCRGRRPRRAQLGGCGGGPQPAPCLVPKETDIPAAEGHCQRRCHGWSLSAHRRGCPRCLCLSRRHGCRGLVPRHRNGACPAGELRTHQRERLRRRHGSTARPAVRVVLAARPRRTAQQARVRPTVFPHIRPTRPRRHARRGAARVVGVGGAGARVEPKGDTCRAVELSKDGR